MKVALTRVLLVMAGLALIGWGLLPQTTLSVEAAPAFAVTETPTGEPPTPTPPPPTATLEPTLTPVPPTSTPPPEDTPRPDRPRPTATPTLTPVPPSPTPQAPGGPPADPAISKSVSPGTARVGDSVEYTIVVTNLGGALAQGVTVNDSLPGFLRPTGVSTSKGEASLSGQSVSVNIGDLAPGETVTIVVSATVIAEATPPNNRNLAVVSSTTPDGNPDNNEASVPLDTIGIPVTLPGTGDDGRGLLPVAALLCGLALVAASLLVRRRSA